VPFRVVPSLFEESYLCAELLGYGELPVIDVDVDPLNRVERVFKRALDVGVSSVVVLMAAVPCLLIFAAIKLDSPGPVFHMQPRVGKNGRRFLMYKSEPRFRTPNRLRGTWSLDEGDGPHSRCAAILGSRVGRFLRKEP
jgi:lipopolysaccharide/colanic/teichoic acid biosynthesis glycosyltransferase